MQRDAYEDLSDFDRTELTEFLMTLRINAGSVSNGS